MMRPPLPQPRIEDGVTIAWYPKRLAACRPALVRSRACFPWSHLGVVRLGTKRSSERFMRPVASLWCGCVFPSQLSALLRDLAVHLPVLLRGNLVAIYLYGSLMQRAFNTRRTDVDCIVVTLRDLTDGQFKRLGAWLARATSGVPVFSMTLDIPSLWSCRPSPKPLEKIIENHTRAAGRALLFTGRVCQHLRISICRFFDDHVVIRRLVYRLAAIATQNNFGHGNPPIVG
jgi:hypothetical protein